MTQISINYARVLYDLEIPGERIEETKRMFQTVPQLSQVLSSPVTPQREKRRVIDRIFPLEIRSFLKEVCDNQDVELLDEIFTAYHSYYCRMHEILEAGLYYVTEPSEDEMDGIRQYLCRKYKAQAAEIKLIQNPGLVGGFLLQVGDEEMDWSLQGRFRQLKQRLMRR